MGALGTTVVVSLFLVYYVIAANSFGDSNENISDRVESGGSRRTTSGRSIVVLTHRRPRAHGIKILSNGTAQELDADNGTYRRRDLHTAYRLPLQRLSDHQLKMIIKKYTNNDTAEYPEIINGVESRTREELLENLQEMIVRKSSKKEGRKLLRPKLISNALLPTQEVHAMGIPIINKKSQQRTTLSTIEMTTEAPHQTGSSNGEGDVRRSRISAHVPVTTADSSEAKTVRTIQADEYTVADGETNRNHESYAEHIISRGNPSSKQYLRQLTDMLRKVKAKYEQVRVEYLNKIKREKGASVVEKSAEAVLRHVHTERKEFVPSHSAIVKASKTHVSEEVIIPEPTANPTPEQTTIEDLVEDIDMTQPTTTEPTVPPTTAPPSSSLGPLFMPVLNKTLIVQQLRKLAALSREYRRNQTRTAEVSAPTPQITPKNINGNKHAGTIEVLEVHDGEASHTLKNDEKLNKPVTIKSAEIRHPVRTKDGEAKIPRRPAPKAKAIVIDGRAYFPERVTPSTWPVHDSSTSKEEDDKKPNEVEMHDGETKGVNAKIFIDPAQMVAEGISKDKDSQAPIKVTMTKVSELTRDPEISVDELVNNLQRELVESQTSTTTATPNIDPETSTVTEVPNVDPETSTTAETSTDLEMENLEAFAQFDENEMCDAIACDFENGSLCSWVSSRDELSPTSPHYLRKTRSTHFIRRSWYNWIGRYRNRVTGIARAQVFSHSNQRFAAAYVRPKQRATLTASILSGEAETLRFRAWEATRDVQLRVCCDNTQNCVFETDKGVKRGTRRWIEHTATCPQGTKKVIFECINLGIFQGACGIDNVFLVNDYCPALLPKADTLEEGTRRLLSPSTINKDLYAHIILTGFMEIKEFDAKSDEEVNIGDFVKLDKAVGEVRYVGPVEGYQGEWIGVDWFNGSRGKHDGTVKGKKYFNTRKYVECTGDIEHKIGAKAVETYLNTAAEKQKLFQLLEVVAVDYGCVNRAPSEPVVFGRCRELNLYGNMISKWSTLLDILEAFPVVRFLNLGMNYFIHDAHFGSDKRIVSAPVHNLILNKCQMTEQMLEIVLRTFPSIRDLHLHETGLLSFNTDPSGFRNIETLSLEGNALESFENMKCLSQLPNLTTLNLAGCKICSVKFNEAVGFPKLKTLSLASNPIRKWSSISELSRLPALTTLNIDHLPSDASREMIIAKIPKLKNLNHSDISAVERRSSEITFLNSCGLAPVLEEHATDIARLQEMYGNPDQAVPDPNEMKLLNLKLHYKDKCVERSFPKNMTIPKLVGVSARLLRFVPMRVSIEAISPEGCKMFVDSELNRDLNFYGIGDGFSCVFSR
ncbi:hypothetical protein QR680_002637 [Steinernema hermaphroditum]|uniref:Tubulin-specific chaperone E n=1 Tax=Steinernema hermaphroditum TaxID=289476 RepID=A0AA39H574_9BILA|nr:hypothetical protein QR680_002637 [Steinernema hermaphroditum]